MRNSARLLTAIVTCCVLSTLAMDSFAQSRQVGTVTPPRPSSGRRIESIEELTLRNKIGPPPSESRPEAPKTLAEQAMAQFKKRDFDVALEIVNKILEEEPQSADALQFRSLVKFAAKDYPGAAADAYDALAHGPMWTRESVVNIYGGGINYTGDYRRLLRSTNENRNSLAHQFLAAYHSLVQGDFAHGERHLELMLELKPEEPVATQLLAIVRQKLESSESK